ncbi:helix-turn-helix domain-containing protein [uncultured Cohaesibacter sp.]|uniref:TetR/AcrR family transcriptional regulator n=1 Tax=uncultured Cohaesibacter sp. TaxID=1002546 RepID=UPI00292D08F4|nr:helix-turn-helix domain-containing protein [uncultured Cohaesibacter sp.]
MRVSREKMAENRQRILAEAARLFREKGVDAVSVAEIMQAAGLTHGGFYGHFRSKDELVCKTMEQMTDQEETYPSFEEFTKHYLSCEHRDNAGEGCATAALGLEFRHQTQEARAELTRVIETQLARLTDALAKEQGEETDPAQVRREAIATWSAMVGALILARAVNDTSLSQEFLESTRDWIMRKD